MNSIQETDLYENQYDENILILNIDNLSVHTILITQKNLSISFINNYILNPKYHYHREDHDITLNVLKRYQPEYMKQQK